MQLFWLVSTICIDREGIWGNTMNTKAIKYKTVRNNLRLQQDLQQSEIPIQMQAQKGPKE